MAAEFEYTYNVISGEFDMVRKPADAEIVNLERKKQDKIDADLQTEAKTIVGAINEVKNKLNAIDLSVIDGGTF